MFYAAHDGLWLRSLGELVTTSIGLVVLARMWQVFPFDFSVYSVRWSVLVRFALVVAIVGNIIGIIVQFVSLVRLAGRGRRRRTAGRGKPVTPAVLVEGLNTAFGATRTIDGVNLAVQECDCGATGSVAWQRHQLDGDGGTGRHRCHRLWTIGASPRVAVRDRG